MTRPSQAMSDDRAELVLREVMQLALTVRDEGLAAVAKQLQRVERAARGDLMAALVIAAALVDPDRPIDRWWQQTIVAAPPPQRPPQRPAMTRPSRAALVKAAERSNPPAPETRPAPTSAHRMAPCGTHAAFNRHKKRREPACEPCLAAERIYQSPAARAERAAARAAATGQVAA